MKYIEPRFTFQLLDVAGNLVLGKTDFAGWELYYQFQYADGTFSSNKIPITSGMFFLAPATPDGTYILRLDKHLIGDDPLFKIHLMLIPPTGDDVKFITPDFYEFVDINVEKINDLNIKLDTYSEIIITENKDFEYSQISLRVKESDDLIFNVQVPARFRPLTGWTNISIQAFPKERALDPTVLPITGTYEATVVDTINGIIKCRIARDILAGRVPSGRETETIYADVQGHSPDGYRHTFIQCDITVVREYNINHQP